MTQEITQRYRLTLEALDENDRVTARYGTRGMDFEAGPSEIGQFVYATIYHHEGLPVPVKKRLADQVADPLEQALLDAQEEVYAINQANGWFEDDRTVGDDVALLHSEVSEMLEA
jgi:hypothetical protein